LPFKLDVGQHAEDLIFKLMPTGIISGRVRDENGEPMPLAVVSAVQTHYSDGKRALVPAMVVVTNDLGEFRLFNLTSGNYLLCVSPGMAIGSVRMASRNLVTVYYPGTTDPSQATPAEVQAGVEIHGIDMGMQSSKTFHVRGQIVGVSGDKKEFGAAVILHKADNEVSPERSNEVGKDGKFDIEGVMPGSYRVIAILPTEGGSPIFIHKTIEVTGADVDGVTLASEGTIVIEGHLKWDDETESTKVQLQVRLIPVEEFFSMPGHSEINKDGSLEIKDVMPDLYSLDITEPAPDAYLKGARYGSADAMGTFRVSGAGGSLELLIGARGARVGGVVMNSDPVVVLGAWVALVPEEAKQKQKRLYQAVRTDANGKYEFRGVAPGSYTLFSWDQVAGHEWEDPEFMKAFEGKGAAISLEEKENKSMDLTLIENRIKSGKQ
jgi:Carboxypeptidase regulatory-like domain